MYLRIGDLEKTFSVETLSTAVNSMGRSERKFISTAKMLDGILAEAKPEEKERWQQLQHPITHTIVQSGAPEAKTGDRLIFLNRYFYIQGTDDIGSLGLYTLFYVEERADRNA